MSFFETTSNQLLQDSLSFPVQPTSAQYVPYTSTAPQVNPVTGLLTKLGESAIDLFAMTTAQSYTPPTAPKYTVEPQAKMQMPAFNPSLIYGGLLAVAMLAVTVYVVRK